MRVVTGPPQGWGLPARGRAVTVGVFDGLHAGHRAVLGLLRRRATELGGLETAVVTFDPHPLAVVAPEHAPRLLTGIAHRLELLEAAGVDVTAVVTFDEEIRLLTPAAFAAGVLAGALHARLVVVGEDFRFGHHRLGNVASLAELGDAHGFAAEILPLVGGQAPVSSTRVRAMVAAGDVEAAAAALGRPHELRGTVVPGEGRGRALGFPTANVALDPGLAVPGSGVYAVRAGRLGEPLRAGVANVGTRPTFGGGERGLEVHLLDGAADLYGATLRVAFVSRLRDERLFADGGELAAQIEADAAAARRRLGARPPAGPGGPTP
jgi:riboflavin kinase/FMN adenylyltransferase